MRGPAASPLRAGRAWHAETQRGRAAFSPVLAASAASLASLALLAALYAALWS